MTARAGLQSRCAAHAWEVELSQQRSAVQRLCALRVRVSQRERPRAAPNKKKKLKTSAPVASASAHAADEPNIYVKLEDEVRLARCPMVHGRPPKKEIRRRTHGGHTDANRNVSNCCFFELVPGENRHLFLSHHGNAGALSVSAVSRGCT